MCLMCEGGMAGSGACYNDAPSAAEIRNEEIEQDWSQQTCDECGFDRAGCNCPDGLCECEDAYEDLRNPEPQWWGN